MEDRGEIEAKLADIVEELGGELIVDDREPTLGRIPLEHGTHGICPHCGGAQFWHEYGDLLCSCARCGRTLTVTELARMAPDEASGDATAG
jgi:hypothetical protein